MQHRPIASNRGEGLIPEYDLDPLAADWEVQARANAYLEHPRGTKHVVAASMIEIAGERAFSICHATLYVRSEVGGVEADIESLILRSRRTPA